MPTVEEVCSSFTLTDVDIEYSDADLENLTSYKLFQQHLRPLIVKENPKVILVSVFNCTYFNSSCIDQDKFKIFVLYCFITVTFKQVSDLLEVQWPWKV